jgi:hypothetical protein
MNGLFALILFDNLNEHYSIDRSARPSYLIVPDPMNSIFDKINYAFLLYYIIKNPESTIIFIFIIFVGVIEFVVNVIIAPELSPFFLLIIISYSFYPLISKYYQTAF